MVPGRQPETFMIPQLYFKAFLKAYSLISEVQKDLDDN